MCQTHLDFAHTQLQRAKDRVCEYATKHEHAKAVIQELERLLSPEA